jgi:hypothetical protein
MDYIFKFFRGQQNVEVIRANISDPANVSTVSNEDGNLDPSKIDKIELIAGDVVVSSDSGEITWTGDIINIKPSLDNLALLPRQRFSELVVYDNGEKSTVAKGYIHIANI